MQVLAAPSTYGASSATISSDLQLAARTVKYQVYCERFTVLTHLIRMN